MRNNTSRWFHGAQVFFGWNLNAVNHGTVAVGDELIVKKTRTAALAA